MCDLGEDHDRGRAGYLGDPRPRRRYLRVVTDTVGSLHEKAGVDLEDQPGYRDPRRCFEDVGGHHPGTLVVDHFIEAGQVEIGVLVERNFEVISRYRELGWFYRRTGGRWLGAADKQ